MKNIEINEDLLTKAKKEYKKPDKFSVVLFSNNDTPMDFVVSILQLCFKKNHENSIKLMLEFRNNGQVTCGTYTKEVAETKAELVLSYCQQTNYGVKCKIERASSLIVN